MWLAIAGVAYLLTLGIDLWVTHKILRFNTKGELNPLTRRTAESIGVPQALIGTVLAPRLLMGAVTAYFAPQLFLLYTGACIHQAGAQIYCVKRGLI